MKANFIHIRILLIIGIVCTLILSCQEDINLELNDQENSRIVVEGRITNEYKRHIIKLTETTSYFVNEKVPALSNAEVYIIEQESQIKTELTESEDYPGYYLTRPTKFKAYKNYNLVVNTDGETYEAEAYLDTVAQMDSINYIYDYELFYDGKYRGYYKIRMSAFEPNPIGQVYMFKVYMNDTLLNRSLDDTPYQDDEFFNNQYMANVEIYWIRQEEIINDTNSLKVEMYSISKEEFKYNNAFITESEYSGSVFSGPPANVPSNLINTSGGLDGLGFFGASSVSTKEMLLIKQHDDSTNDPDYESD